MDSPGIYIHIPFCISKCNYCDFASLGRDRWDESMMDGYVECLCREIRQSSHQMNPRGVIPDTIHLGGGTPSLLGPRRVSRVLDALLETFGLENGGEITLEINPATSWEQDLADYRRTGVNRVSIGVQSFDDGLLSLLGRCHNAETATKTLTSACEIFPSVSIDLMYAIPGQSSGQWQRDLLYALSFPVNHISAYELTPESGTPTGDAIFSGVLSIPEEEETEAMYFDAGRILEEAGFCRYEVSNYCREDGHSRHNVKYWKGIPVLGFGSSASSHGGMWRWANVGDPVEYIQRIRKGMNPMAFGERLSTARRTGEFMMLGLRMSRGVSARRFYELFQRDMMEYYREEIRELQQDGLLHMKQDETETRVYIPGDRILLQGYVAGKFLPC